MDILSKARSIISDYDNIMNQMMDSKIMLDQDKMTSLSREKSLIDESYELSKEYVGLQDIQIEGVQRYPLSNHLNWLANGKPGGHKSQISMLDSDALYDMYQNSLARMDATDTLVAIAKVP